MAKVNVLEAEIAKMDVVAVDIPGAMHVLGGVSRATIYNLARKGKLRFCKIGRRTVVPMESIRDLIK